MTGQRILEGDLARVPIPDLLTFSTLIRATGRMMVRNGDMERSIHWKDGDIVFAHSNSPEHSLGEFLLRQGRITEKQLAESRERLTPEVRHGKLLVQMGILSPNDLWWGVKNQVLEILYSLFTWRSGSFILADEVDDISHERIVLAINTTSLILEGIRRLDERSRIEEKIPRLDMVFEKVSGSEAHVGELDITQSEMMVYHEIDGRNTVRDLVRRSDLTEFEVLRILYQLYTARLVEIATDEKTARPVFLDVEDSPELLKVVSTYNDMFARLFDALRNAVGESQARDIVSNVMQSADTNELWSGVYFDASGRFDENMLIANISELPFEQRKSVLDEGLNTLLSIQLFEVSQHLDAPSKIQVFRFISEQKSQLEKTA